MITTERPYCPIRGFTVWTPDGDSMLAYDWEPLKARDERSRNHLPLRVVAHRQGVAIAREELSYLRQRLAELGAEIQAEQTLQAFRAELDALQGKVRELLGVRI